MSQTKEATETEKYFARLTEAHLKRISEASAKDSFVVDGKTYTRRKITTRAFHQLEKARAAFSKEEDQDKATDILAGLYKDAAQMYLGMTDDEFFNSSWEELKFAIDACNFRTIYGSFLS